MGGGAWPFLVGGVVNSVNEQLTTSMSPKSKW